MSALVQTLVGERIFPELRAAYVTLARAYLLHRGDHGASCTLEPADPMVLDRLVCAMEERIDLRAAREVCGSIGKDSERPGEVFNNLGHMFVLLEAMPLLVPLGLTPTTCAPTQQSQDDAGVPIADLSGSGWALEAFGGVEITSNGKLAKDLRSLTRWLGSRTLLACRPDAWPQVGRRTLGASLEILATCSKAHGGPFRVTATVAGVARSDTVTVIEVRNIEVDSRRTDLP